MNDEVIDLLRSYVFQDDLSRERKIIFWYDEKEAYKDEIDNLVFTDDIELIKYDNNSFWIRYHIEVEEPNKNFIIYLPFDRKKGLDNDLLDLESSNINYLFNPDQTTMWLKELGLKDDKIIYNLVKKNQKFFKDKKRRNKFNEFDIEEKNEDNINLIIISSLLNIKTISLDEIFKTIIISYYDDKKKYEDLIKWSDDEFLIELFNSYFGSSLSDLDEIELLFKSLIFTYFASDLNDLNDISRYSKYLLNKKTNVHIFVDTLMRDSNSKKYFEKISKAVEKEFGIDALIKDMDIDRYKYNDAFICMDNYIINNICDSLLSDIGQYDKYNELIQIRNSKYWFSKLSNEYNSLKIASKFLENIDIIIKQIKTLEFDEFTKNYIENLSMIDTLYRKFYYYTDKVNSDKFKELEVKIENKYVNDFLSELSIKWSQVIEELPKYNSTRIMLQNTFFNNYIKPYKDKKNRAIVVISDAFRYEVANELNDKLLELGAKSKIDYMLGLVPSYTKLGMASLLPNKNITLVDNSDDILVDDMKTSSIQDRQEILTKECGESLAIKYTELNNMKKSEWKTLFSGKKVVYIYHDVIDATGEKTDEKVFNACEEAIEEIYRLIKDLHTTFSGVDLFVTADHGFLYKRGKYDNTAKATKTVDATKQKKRYSYSNDKSNEEGILSINLDYIFGENSGYVNIPKGNSVFAIQGLSTSYVHGGIMPQEILVPVIDFKSTRNIEEAGKVKISYTGLSVKITNAITLLDFTQTMPVDENNKACRYLIHFEDDKNERISNECVIIADNISKDVKDRFYKEKFVFKNIKYDRNKDYYLVITDEETGIEESRVKFTIDIAISNTFNF